MPTYAELALQLQSADDGWVIAGPQPESRVDAVESKLQIRLPDSYRKFLIDVGRIDYPNHGYEGLDDDYLHPVHGFGKFTRALCENNELPDGLFVLEHDHEADEVACLDLTRMDNNECPVIWYDTYRNVVSGPCSDSFDSLFRELVESWVNL